MLHRRTQWIFDQGQTVFRRLLCHAAYLINSQILSLPWLSQSCGNCYCCGYFVFFPRWLNQFPTPSPTLSLKCLHSLGLRSTFNGLAVESILCHLFTTLNILCVKRCVGDTFWLGSSPSKLALHSCREFVVCLGHVYFSFFILPQLCLFANSVHCILNKVKWSVFTAEPFHALL